MAHLKEIEYRDTHRLIPTKYADESVLATLPVPQHVVSDLSELDAATNERKIAEHGGSPGIGPGELLFGIPEAHIVNAAYTHPGPFGGRFHSSTRGAWYAGVEIETSMAEVSFHKRRFLQEARIHGRYALDYVDFLADFVGDFHRLDPSEIKECSQPGPIPECYLAPQALANRLLFSGSSGIVYQSVRHTSGTCIACFRPALVSHPRRDREYRITLEVDSMATSYEISKRSRERKRP